ncbi:MAG: trypsin-like peptidase domain-containing protein [Victivallales bacterium]
MKKYLAVVFVIALSISNRAAETENLRTTPVVRAVSEVLPSVVNIGTERIVSRPYSRWGDNDPFEGMFRDFFAEQGAVNTTSLGSGSVIDQSGLIITNSHVVSRATKITVTLDDGSQYTAREIASDDFNDIALLMLENLPEGKKFKPLKFARPEDLLLGETVIAVGNPYGLGNSISQGVLSAKGRKATYEGKVIFSDIIQTDAAINPGNSGGPLINLDGELIGISTAIFKDAQGIGFALPVKRVEDVLARWLIPERFGDVSLGIVPGQRKNPSGAMDFFVAEIIPGSPAEKSGLKKDDRILEVNGVTPSRLPDISLVLWKIQSGGEIRIRISELKTITMKTEKIKYAGGLEMAKAKLGLGLQELTLKLAKALDYPFEGGLVVSDLPGDSENVSRGDILVKLGEVPVNNSSDIAKALLDKHYGDSVEAIFVSLIRKNGKYYVMKRASLLKVK